MSNKRSRVSGNEFPSASLTEALPYLRRPPTAEAVRFKIQTVAGELVQVAPYLDARLVFDRLDLVSDAAWTGYSPRRQGTRSDRCGTRRGARLP